MKKLLLLLVVSLYLTCAHAAYLKNIPMTLTQPDGTVLQCFASGDEFFNYLHDANGYTIMQHPKTGFFVYAEKREGQLVATEFVAGRQDPSSKGLQPYALITAEEWRAKRQAWAEPAKPSKSREYNPNHGTLNNISIFVRFSDDGELTNSYSAIDNMFNDISAGAISMRNYFKAASYGAIEIPTTFYPGHNGDAIISYRDTYPRSYFEPYNSSTNTNGYQSDDDRREREFSLLERAVNYINENYPIPTSINIDYDSDDFVDNVCFIVKGGVGAWSSLLWPHKWSLYDRAVYINGKRVWTFNFQLADATSYFNTSTMCHEMNHSLSAPDLYHYDVGGDLQPVGVWDLMENNATPPQHCGAYMKMKYGHWIDIPEITQAGTYTLDPISSAVPTNVAYKIQSEDPNQFYVLEYRDNTSLFETALPGSGLLVYRIDTRFDGNAGYDPDNGIYDEVYLFRPGGSPTTNGNLDNAYFSANVGRTEFSSNTSNYPFFTDGAIDYNFKIYNITAAGNTISFSYGTSSDCEAPTNLTATVEGNNVTLSWDAANNAQSYNIYRSGTLIGNTSETTFTDGGIPFGRYEYFIRSVDSNGLISSASDSVTVNFVPQDYYFIGDGGSATNDLLPSYNYYNYSLTQQIYTIAELGDAGVINTIAFYNDGAEKTRNYDFYLKSTTKTQFSSSSDWETISESDIVFSGTVTLAAQDWTFITLDHAFNYDGNSNIVLVADDNSGSWSGTPHMSCRVFSAPRQAIRIYSDDVNYNPMAPGGYNGTVMEVKNQILLSKYSPSTNPITISVSASPARGGIVNGGGVFNFGEICTVTAEANHGFHFVGWTENDQVVSLEPEFSFSAINDRTLVALFEDGIQIGDGGTTTNQFLPSYSFYNHTLSQQIYTADEIGAACTITSISFFNGGAEKTRNYDMYLVHTDKITFSNNYDWITVTEDDKVFSGQVAMVSNSWTVFTLDTPFEFDGTSNLALIMDDNTGSYSNGMMCRVFNAPNQAIRIYSDGTNYDPTAPSSYSGTIMNEKNQIIITTEIDNESGELAFEPFEEYTVGNPIASQAIAAGHDWWTTWSNNPGSDEDGLVANYDGNQCGYISGTADNVLLLGHKESGMYDLEFDILVPEGKNGYFNVLHHFDGFNSVWAMQVYLHLTNDGQNSTSTPGIGTVHAGSNGTCELPCVYDEWMHFRIRVDIDKDLAKLYFNEMQMCQWQWSLDSFGSNTVEPILDAMDFFAPMTDGTSEFYIDNLSIKMVTPITQTIELLEGWNWVSTYVVAEDSSEALLMLQESLGDNGLMIKSKMNFTMYDSEEGWGAMGDLEELDNGQMYMVQVAANCTAELQGLPVDTEGYAIIITQGWNWIGFPSTVTISIEDAFANFEPEDGDQIKSNNNYSMYFDGEWSAMGDLEALYPGQGFMYYSNSTTPKTIVFLVNNQR